MISLSAGELGIIMKIIIVGAGQVGATLTENLVREYADITLIDICLLYTSPSPRDRG